MAVYTHLSNHELADIVASYNIGQLVTASDIAKGVSNSNYLLTVEKNNQITNYIFTLFEERTHPDDLPFCFALTNHLVKKKFPCPVPLKNKDNQILTMVKNKPAAIISFLSGREKEKWNDDDCFAAGQTLGQLHVQTADFSMTQENKLSLSGWEKLWALSKERFLNPATANDIKALEEKFTTVKNHWATVPADLPRGACHADFFPDNIFFEDANSSRVCGVIDFYFACTDRLAYDLAIALTAWCFAKPNAMFQPAMAKQLLAGYQTVRPLLANEKKYFIPLLIGAAWRFILTRFYDYHNHKTGDVVTRKDPMFYRQMLDWLLAPANQKIIMELL